MDESFNIVNNSDYELKLNYNINGSELDASVASNYNEAGEFIGDLDFNISIAPGQTLTFYTLTMRQHATWHATGHAEPEEIFEYMTVEAIENNNAISQAVTPIFKRYEQELFMPAEEKISGSVYEYTATINNSDLPPNEN